MKAEDIQLAQTDQLEIADERAARSATASANESKKPFFKKLLGITSKFKEAHSGDILNDYGPTGKKLALLLPDETLDMSYNKGKKDFLLFTSKRLIHIDGSKAAVLKRLAGDKGKAKYTSYPWRHISEYKTTTLGAGEKFSLNQETELHVKPSMGAWMEFEFDKEVNILQVNNYFSKNILAAPQLKYDVLPFLSGVARLVYSSETTGRLKMVTFDALPKEVEESLLPNEKKLAAFSHKKTLSISNTDYVLVTDQRIISIDKIGAKKVELDNKPYSSSLRDAITAVSVTTAGGFDFDSEMFVDVIGVGRNEADFGTSTDTLALYKRLTEWVLS